MTLGERAADWFARIAVVLVIAAGIYQCVGPK